MAKGWTQRAAWVRILCALALICVGFAHKPPVIDPRAIPAQEISAYVLPDGTLAELCLPDVAADGKVKPHLFGTGCEACRLSGSVVLATPPRADGEVILATLDVLSPPLVEALHGRVFPPAAAPRAPPSFRSFA